MLQYTTATLQDIPYLIPLLNELFTQEKEFIPNENLQIKALEKIISDENIGKIYICKKEDKIIAMVNILFTISTALGEKVALLEDMIVNKDFQAQKIGSNFLEYVINELKKDNIQRITLLTDFDNIKAHKFYEKLLFKKSSMIPFRLNLN